MTTTVTRTAPATAVALAHHYRMPAVREVVPSEHRPRRQRDLVLASLVRCPRDPRPGSAR
jgi:hypothetical protein